MAPSCLQFGAAFRTALADFGPPLRAPHIDRQNKVPDFGPPRRFWTNIGMELSKPRRVVASAAAPGPRLLGERRATPALRPRTPLAGHVDGKRPSGSSARARANSGRGRLIASGESPACHRGKRRPGSGTPVQHSKHDRRRGPPSVAMKRTAGAPFRMRRENRLRKPAPIPRRWRQESARRPAASPATSSWTTKTTSRRLSTNGDGVLAPNQMPMPCMHRASGADPHGGAESDERRNCSAARRRLRKPCNPPWHSAALAPFGTRCVLGRLRGTLLRLRHLAQTGERRSHQHRAPGRIAFIGLVNRSDSVAKCRRHMAPSVRARRCATRPLEAPRPQRNTAPIAPPPSQR